MNNKFLNMLGLARRAGKAQCGEGRVLSAIRGGRVKLLIIAADASSGAKKKFSDACKYHGVPFFESASGDEIGASLGLNFTAAVAVTDENFADGLTRISGFNDCI